MSLKQSLLGLIKNVFLLLKINSKFIIAPTISKILWPLPLMLILDIFHPKTLLDSFWGRENGLKADKICKLISHLNICLHYHIFIRLQIAYEHTNFTAASCTSVKSKKLLVKFCLIYQYQLSQLLQPQFV